MKWLMKMLMVLVCHSALASGLVAAEQITVLTTDFPPYSFSADGQLTGLSTEIVQAVLARADIKTKTFKVYPWARSYTMAKSSSNTLIYSIARSSERESLFQWVGPLAPYQVKLYKLRSRSDIAISDLQQAKRFQIGGEYQDIKQLYLKSQGFKEDSNIELERTVELNIRKLFAGRIDLLPISETSLPYILRSEGFSMADVESALALDEISNPLYMAFSLDVPTETVARAAYALQQLLDEGIIQTIYATYIR